MPEHNEKLHTGIKLLRSIHEALVDLEVQLQMELVGHPADSGFGEAIEDVNENWSRFNDLFVD